MALLELADLEAFYHGVRALHVERLHVDAGELVSVIGPNGAGKTTLLRSVSRLVDTRGAVRFDGVELERFTPREVIQHGVIHCPEGRHLFPKMSVLDNLRMGAFIRHDRAAIQDDLARAFEIFPVLADRRKQLAGTLSGGEQQMLAIARSLMSRPRLLLLDEPSFGLAPLIVERIGEVVQTLNREQRLTIVLVEQNASLALQVAQRTWILEGGEVRREAEAAVLLADPAVQELYLGIR